MVKENKFVTSDSTWFLIKSGGSIKKLIWRAVNLQNENMHMKFRKKEHIEFDDSMDPDDANE